MRIIIVGCGRVGAGLAYTLTVRGHSITVIDRDAQALKRLGAAFRGHTVVGLAFDRETLLRAGIDRADGLAAVTSSDEANIVTAQLARDVFRVPRVVARLYDPAQAEIYHRLGLQTIAPVTWGVNRIADMLCYSQFDAIASLGDGRVDIVEADIPHLLAGRPLRELSLPGEANVVAIHREGKTFLPTSGTLFEAGDRVYLVVRASSIERVKSLLGLT